MHIVQRAKRTERDNPHAELTHGLTPDQLPAAPDSDEWSANDVPAHLRACADVWGDCIAIILEQDTPTLRAVNPTTWIKKQFVTG